MSLNHTQIADTIKEFQLYIEELDLSVEQIAEDLQTTAAHIEQLVQMKVRRYEEPWILRNYLLEQAALADMTLPAFSALAGDHHHYWFLNDELIDQKKLG